MDNYARALAYAQTLFLKWDQEAIVARCGLRADDNHIHLNFLGEPFRIERASGAVECVCGAPRPASFIEALSIYDYLCRTQPLPLLSGRLCPANALKHVAQSSPNDVSFHRRAAERYKRSLPALKEALRQLGVAPFSPGDAACVFPVFDGFNAVFQFWEGDEEFPPSVRFLWDEVTPDCLKYETLYYIMGCFLNRLDARICEIEKNA